MLTIHILLLSAWYRAQVKFVPMSKLQKSFGEAGRLSENDETSDAIKYAKLVGTRVERICKKTAWDSKCLVRALVARKLLSGKNIHTTLYLGLRKEEGKMHAHAWLRCGSLYVAGGAGEEDHTIVSYFYK